MYFAVYIHTKQGEKQVHCSVIKMFVFYCLDNKLGENVQTEDNAHLFEWVLENLIRNSLDVMSGKGTISISLYKEDGLINIDVADNGKVIPSSKFKTVFNPGFSTKQHGWGLGLSLAKRILEEYNKGKIFVKCSRIDEGTCFTIRLQNSKSLL
jgi:signal transduction histidine kinase